MVEGKKSIVDFRALAEYADRMFRELPPDAGQYGAGLAHLDNAVMQFGAAESYALAALVALLRVAPNCMYGHEIHAVFDAFLEAPGIRAFVESAGCIHEIDGPEGERHCAGLSVLPEKQGA
jgi:hypothetical protein